MPQDGAHRLDIPNLFPTIPSGSRFIYQFMSLDSLSHYLSCSVFWALLNSACRSPASQWDVSPQANMCLADPEPFDIQRLAVAFRVYHILNLGHRREIESAAAADDFDRMHKLFLELSRFFASEHVLCQDV